MKLRGVSKAYTRGGESVPVLEGLDLDVPSGSYEALMGPSGSGKTTLLNLIAGLDRPTAGAVEVAGKRLEGARRGRAGQVARRARSASSSSRTTCCRCSRRSRTSSCRSC